MTAATLTRLPLVAGGAIASSAGRIGLWAISHFARAPLAYSSVFALTTLSLMAANNVLFNQHQRHPAPLFASTATAQVIEGGEQVQPATRQAAVRSITPDYISEPVSPQTTGSVSAQAVAAEVPDGEPIGNAKVYEVQKKLAQLKYFNGKVDGYYGPMTASAIRQFELAAGLKPQGALTQDVVDMILRAPANEQMLMMQGQAETPAPVQIQPVQQQAVAAAPANVYVAPQQAQQPVPPLVFTQPASQQVAAAPQSDQPVLIARQVKPTATEVFDEVADGAANAFDAVASGIQGLVNQPNGGRQANAVRQAPQPPAQVVSARQQDVRQPAPTAQQTAALQAPPTAQSSTDPQLVAKVQRGLASLGFLAGSVDGVPGEATAKAIRNFEVYYNYDVTGKVTPQLVDMLTQAGAVI